MYIEKKRIIPIFLCFSVMTIGMLHPVNAYADTTVYVTRTGTKYHLKKNCRGLNNAAEIGSATFNEYISQHLDPCKICVKTPLKVPETKAKVKKKTKSKGPKKVKVQVSVSKKKYTYNGKVRHPSVKVFIGADGSKCASSNYIVIYPDGCKKVGTYKVKVKMKGKYKGTGNVKFKIVPPPTNIRSISADSKQIVLNWKKKKKQVDGYQVQYSTDSYFIFDKNSIVVEGNNKLSTTISDVKRLRTYYLRVRSFKNSNNKKYYSKWSEVQSVKVPFLKKKKVLQEYS